MSSRTRSFLAAGLLTLGATPALAHVKWFSDFDFTDTPLPLGEILQPTFFALLALSIVVMSGLVWIDVLLRRFSWVEKIDAWLDARRGAAPVVMRVFLGAMLLTSWQADALFVPELAAPHPTIGWIQFFLALALLTRETTPIAGAGLTLLYVYAVVHFGPLHMLDYTAYGGAGIYLALQGFGDRPIAGGLPILYTSVGFGLVWVAMEKLVYPGWGLEVLARQPLLTLGLDPEFFLMSAAFIEICLGFLLLIGLLGRPTALLITLTFMTTSTVFGKVEIIGHTLLHGGLIVFILEGSGAYRPPVYLHDRLPLRIGFTAASLLLVIGLLLPAYSLAAQRRAGAGAEPGARHSHGSVASPDPAPQVALAVEKDPIGGWNLHLQTSHFEFRPDLAGTAHLPGAGHGHLYVDGVKRARLYSTWYHLPDLPAGSHELRVTLNANDHRTYHAGGRAVEASATIEQP